MKFLNIKETNFTQIIADRLKELESARKMENVRYGDEDKDKLIRSLNRLVKSNNKIIDLQDKAIRILIADTRVLSSHLKRYISGKGEITAETEYKPLTLDSLLKLDVVLDYIEWALS